MVGLSKKERNKLLKGDYKHFSNATSVISVEQLDELLLRLEEIKAKAATGFYDEITKEVAPKKSYKQDLLDLLLYTPLIPERQVNTLAIDDVVIDTMLLYHRKTTFDTDMRPRDEEVVHRPSAFINYVDSKKFSHVDLRNNSQQQLQHMIDSFEQEVLTTAKNYDDALAIASVRPRTYLGGVAYTHYFNDDRRLPFMLLQGYDLKIHDRKREQLYKEQHGKVRNFYRKRKDGSIITRRVKPKIIYFKKRVEDVAVDAALHPQFYERAQGDASTIIAHDKDSLYTVLRLKEVIEEKKLSA